MEVRNYSDDDQQVWDDFVQQSKNGTFLFRRGYMDYHRDRFKDHSLIVHDGGAEPLALLPAHRAADTLHSHGGLTYGGFITTEAMKLPKMLEVFERVVSHLQQAGFTRMIYKTVPSIYHRIPAEEDRCALFVARARIVRRGALAVVAREARPSFQERRVRGIKKAQKQGVTVKETQDFDGYWKLLTDRLRESHQSSPVHTADEIKSLRTAFPANIRLFGAFAGDELLGGVVIHETDRVARAQYIAASSRGQACGALDLTFSELLTREYRTKCFFDLGTSDEANGWSINKGLIDQKEGYGARVVAHDHYELGLSAIAPGQIIGAMQ